MRERIESLMVKRMAAACGHDDEKLKHQQRCIHTFSALLGPIQNSRGLGYLPAKNKAVIQRDLNKPGTAIRVDAAFVVVPYSTQK
jgi:hypothetical protein